MGRSFAVLSLEWRLVELACSQRRYRLGLKGHLLGRLEDHRHTAAAAGEDRHRIAVEEGHHHIVAVGEDHLDLGRQGKEVGPRAERKLVSRLSKSVNV